MPIEIGNLEEPWQYELVDVPNLGLNLSNRSDNLQRGEALTLDNLRTDYGKVRIDTGYAAFGVAVLGTPRKEWAFRKTDATIEDLLLTNLTLYKWATGATEWQFVKGPQSTTVATTGAVATDTQVKVASDTGFADNDDIGIILDDGTMFMTVVSGTPSGNIIQLDDAFPSAAAISNLVVEPPRFAGVDTIPVDMITVSFANTVIITNGVDKVQKYDGTDCVQVTNMPSSGNTICRALGQIATYLLLIDTTEGGVRKRQRVRRCDTANIAEWTTGNAGFNDLLDNDDACTAFKMLGTIGIVYKERSICTLELVATEDRLFQVDEDVVINEGVVTPDQVVIVGGVHYFRGLNNIYRYKGGNSIEPVGDNILSKVFLISGEADPTYLNRSILMHVKELNELWMFYTKTGDTWPKNIMKFNLLEESFFHRELTHSVSGIGKRNTDTVVTWAELVGDWASQNFIWASPSLLAGSPTIHLCNPTNLRVYAYDYLAGTDAGTELPFVYETQDFYNAHSSLRLDSLDIYCAGTSVKIEVSVDEGDTWVTIEASLTLTVAIAKYTVNRQIEGTRLRFRFSGTGGGFNLSWYGFLFSLENEFG